MSSSSSPAIGVDFDNTIADYDELMHAIAVERDLIPAEFPRNKKLIRDAIRSLPDGESQWRSLQVTAYGPRMHEARLIEGAREFFLECRRRKIPVYIVSHKTEFANFGEGGVNLRTAAAAWLERQGFFDEAQLGLPREHVFFETTREEKIARAKSLRVTHFIDDLEETFGEDSFPADVEKLLLAPLGQPTELSNAVSFRAWQEIHDQVLGGMSTVALAKLTGSAVRTVSRIGRGGNSKVYRVNCADGKSYAAKLYFQPTVDGLDRLDVEFGALEFLWRSGERSVPRPLAVDRERRIAVYEFVPGDPIDSRSAGENEIAQLADFAARLKRLASMPDAETLPRAAEACFSFREIDESIRGRLARLDSVEGDSPSYSKLGEFLRNEVHPALDEAVVRIRTQVGPRGWTAELPRERRTLSPSDLGFHNTLRRPDGSVLFLDFEYFGWDDPAKLIADFVLHPAMQLSDEAKRTYVRMLLLGFASDPRLGMRLELVYPLFAIKWCTILLNEFVPSYLERREFAVRGSVDPEERRLRQLSKARKMLNTARAGCIAPSAATNLQSNISRTVE